MDKEAWFFGILGMLHNELHPKNAWPLETMDMAHYTERLGILTDDILKFFVEGDGYDSGWFHAELDDTVKYLAASLEPFPAFRNLTVQPSEAGSLEAHALRDWLLVEIAKVGFLSALDCKEHLAVDAAKRGDFRAMAQIIEEKGVLRTKEARKLVSDKLNGKKAKRGEPKTTVNRDALLAVLTVMKDRKCDFSEAQNIILNDDVLIDADTFKRQVRRGLEENPRIKWALGKLEEPPRGQEQP